MSGGGADRRWWTLIAMTGALSMILLDATVVSVALPTIQRDLDLTQVELQWVLNAYLLTLAAFVAVAGRLTDMFNRVHVFSLGVVVFTVASAVSGLAQDEAMIIGARAVQGVGAALMIPPSQTLVLNAFRLDERGKAMGIYAGVSLVFLSLGPLLGGLFTEIDWRLVFWINLPVGLATLALTRIARPDGRVAERGRMDWPGFATLVVGLGALVLGLMQASSWGWGSPETIVALVVGTVMVAAFIVIELRARTPLLELRLFAGRNFSANVAVLFFVQFGLMGASVFGAIYAQDLLGFTPIEAGASLLPLTLPLLLIAPLAGRVYDRIGPRQLVGGGAILAGAGLLLNGLLLHDLDYWILLPGYVMLGAGLGLVMSPANTDALNASPADRRGAASGAVMTMRQVGGTFGIAILGTIVSSVATRRLDDVAASVGATPEQTAEAERILTDQSAGADMGSGENAILARVPAAERESLVEQAKEAVADGIGAAYITAAVILIVVGVVAFIRLRRLVFTDDGPPPAPMA